MLIKTRWLRRRFLSRCDKSKCTPIRTLPDRSHIASHLVTAIRDMRFNLAPKAPVYERPTPEETEAMACIEALARVPQQVVKWGVSITRWMMPNLYRIYYQEVIPECIKHVERRTGKAWSIRYTRPNKVENSWKKSLSRMWGKIYPHK